MKRHREHLCNRFSEAGPRRKSPIGGFALLVFLILPLLSCDAKTSSFFAPAIFNEIALIRSFFHPVTTYGVSLTGTQTFLAGDCYAGWPQNVSNPRVEFTLQVEGDRARLTKHSTYDVTGDIVLNQAWNATGGGTITTPQGTFEEVETDQGVWERQENGNGPVEFNGSLAYELFNQDLQSICKVIYQVVYTSLWN
jgi:hypothetical protein